MSTRKIAELFDRADSLPIGPQERAVLDEAVALALEIGDEELEYQARMRITNSAYMSGDLEAALASWTWCLGKYDEDPSRFPLNWQEGYGDVLWQYKWMVSMMASHPQFSQAQVQQLLTDMETRYRKAGIGLSGVWQTRIAAAVSLGRYDEALAYVAKRDAVGRDDYSHCEACVRAEDAELYAALGDEEKALALYDEIIRRRYTCGDEPEHIQAQAMLWLLRAGRIKDAIEAHKHSLRAQQSGPDPVGDLDNHLVFLAITGNEARGLALLERYLPDYSRSVIDLARRFHLMLAIGVLGDAVAQAGFGDTPVRGTENAKIRTLFGLGDGTRVSAAELAAAAWKSGQAIASDYDRRNGNDAYRDKVAQYRQISGQRFAAAMGGETFVSLALPPPRVAESAEDWLDEMRENLVFREDPQAALAALEPLLATGDVAVSISGLGVAVQAQVLLDDLHSARRLVSQRADLLRKDGRPELADLEDELGLLPYVLAGDGIEELLLARMDDTDDPETMVALTGYHAAWLHQNQQVREAVAVAKGALVLLDVLADCDWVRRRLTSVAFQLLQLMSDNSDFDEGLELAQRFLGQPELCRRPFKTAVLGFATRFAMAIGDFEAALRYAEDWLTLLIQIGHRPRIVEGVATTGICLTQLGRAKEAADRFRLAIRHATIGGLDTLELKLPLGLALVDSEQMEDAAEVLGEFYGSMTDKPFGFRVFVGLKLLPAQLETGDYRAAFAMLSTLIDEAKMVDQPELLWQLATERGQLNLRFGDADGVDDLATAAKAAAKLGEPGKLAQALHVLGQARFETGVGDGMADLIRAEQCLLPTDETWLLADVRDSRGRALLAKGEVSEGVSLLLLAADGYAAADDERAAAISEIVAARALVLDGRPVEAVVVYHSLLERLDDADERASFAAELAEVEQEFGLGEANG